MLFQHTVTLLYIPLALELANLHDTRARYRRKEHSRSQTCIEHREKCPRFQSRQKDFSLGANRKQAQHPSQTMDS